MAAETIGRREPFAVKWNASSFFKQHLLGMFLFVIGTSILSAVQPTKRAGIVRAANVRPMFTTKSRHLYALQ